MRVPEGDYGVKVTVDSGPLAGEITGSTEVSFTGLAYRGAPPKQTIDEVTGWISTHQSHLVIGGVFLLVFAVVLTRITPSKREVEVK